MTITISDLMLTSTITSTNANVRVTGMIASTNTERMSTLAHTSMPGTGDKTLALRPIVLVIFVTNQAHAPEKDAHPNTNPPMPAQKPLQSAVATSHVQPRTLTGGNTDEDNAASARRTECGLLLMMSHLLPRPRAAQEPKGLPRVA